MSEKELHDILDEIRNKGKSPSQVTQYSIDGEAKSYEQIIAQFSAPATPKPTKTKAKKSFFKKIFA